MHGLPDLPAKSALLTRRFTKPFTGRELGLIVADLGGGLIKQRIPRPGQGKSGGYRSMVLFRRGERALFVFGFAKRNMDNVEDDEIEYFKKMAREVLALNDEQLALLIVKGLFEEVKT